MSFGRPALLALLLLAPAAAWCASWLWRRRLDATAAWASRELWPRLGSAVSPRRLRILTAWLALAVFGGSLALARPRWGQTTETVVRRGVDVILVLDVSRSMAATDVLPTRLEVAKTLTRRLAQELPGHRLGLVGAEGYGVVLAPLTTDAGVLDLLLDAIVPGSLAAPGTELAPALDTALGLYPQGSDRHRALVLISDFEDHGGGLTSAAGRLAQAQVVVHTLGVATPKGAPVPDPQADDGVKRDRQGQLVISRLGSEALEALARTTGGLPTVVLDAATDLGPIVDAINGMTARDFESTARETAAERFQWPLALACLALIAHLATAPFPRSSGAERTGWRSP